MRQIADCIVLHQDELFTYGPYKKIISQTKNPTPAIRNERRVLTVEQHVPETSPQLKPRVAISKCSLMDTDFTKVNSHD